MILRDKGGTSHDLASLFRGKRSTLERWQQKFANRTATEQEVLQKSVVLQLSITKPAESFAAKLRLSAFTFHF